LNTPETQSGGSLEPVGSARWRVRFMCKGGGYHPVWYGEHEGPTIQRDAVEMAAKAYLRSQKHWLKRIDVIEADEKPNGTDHRLRATDFWHATEASSRGSVHPPCSAKS